MLKKCFRSLKWLLLTISLVMLALLAAPFFIDVNNYKDDFSQLVHEETGLDLSIEHIELSVFPWLGFTLHGVHVKNQVGFQAEHLLRVKTIDMQLALVPLFSQEIEVKRFELHAPHIWLEQHRDGRHNWELTSQTPNSSSSTTAMTQNHPAPAASTSPSTDGKSALAMRFNAKLLTLTDGLISWTDDIYGNITLSDIQLAVHDLQLEHPIAIDLSARLAQDSFTVHADIGPLGELQDINWMKLPMAFQVQSQGIHLAPFRAWLPALNEEQQAQFGDLTQARLHMDISMEQHADGQLLSSGKLQLRMKHQLDLVWKLNVKNLQNLHLQTFDIALNKTPVLSLSGDVKNMQRRPSFEMRLASASLSRLWLNPFLPDLEKLYQNHPKAWKNIQFDAFIAGDSKLLDIRNLQLQLDDESIQVSGNVVLGKAPDIQLRITSESLHLDPWIPQSKAEPIQKQPSTKPNHASAIASPTPIEPDLSFLKPWYVSLQLNIQALHLLKLDIQALRLTLSAEKGIIRLNPLRFDIGGGQITEHFTLNARNHPVTWQESMRMTGVQVLPILKALADVDVLSGEGQLNTDFTGKGLLPDTIRQHLKGYGQFVFEDGKVKGLNIAQEIRSLQNSAASPQHNNTDFAQMQGSFTVKKGILRNKDLYMASPLFRLTGKGKLFLTPLKVDYHVRPKLIQSLEGQGGGKQKGIVVPLHISGPFDQLNITIEMDKDALLESAAALNKLSGNKIGGVAGQILEQGFVKTREAEKKKLAAKLKKQLADEKARLKKQLEDKLKQQAEDKLKNALKGFSF